jgi:hypothetical protein
MADLAVTLLLAGTGVLFMALSIPLIRRRVKPNMWYGLRVQATFEDEWVWYEANVRSAWGLLAIGAVMTGLAFAPVGPLVWVAVVLVAVLGWAGWSVRVANRLLRDREAGLAGSAGDEVGSGDDDSRQR